MTNPLLFCNVGWMNQYEGVTQTDEIIGGGQYVVTNRVGGEIYSFQKRDGYCYGYVQPVSRADKITGGTINIEKLGAAPGAKFIEGIDVVITAKRPKEGGTFVVGWYKNAMVFRDKQNFDEPMAISDKDTQGNQYGYRFYAPANQVTRLHPDARIMRVPRATGLSPVKGGMGQSNVWYAQSLDDGGVFLSEVRNLIDGGVPNASKKNRRSKPDIEKNKLVEISAIELTRNHFESYGYAVESVEADNCGWDLEATTSDIKLKVEVKGLSGKVLNVELTHNEYKALTAEDNMVTYRLCVVTECLSNEPKLKVFAFNIPSKKWLSENGECLKIQEKVAASITLD